MPLGEISFSEVRCRLMQINTVRMPYLPSTPGCRYPSISLRNPSLFRCIVKWISELGRLTDLTRKILIGRSRGLSVPYLFCAISFPCHTPPPFYCLNPKTLVGVLRQGTNMTDIWSNSSFNQGSSYIWYSRYEWATFPAGVESIQSHGNPSCYTITGEGKWN